MASIQSKIKFENKSEKEIYEAAILAVPQAGLKVWKTRELALLVIAHGEVDGMEVRCNIVVSMVDKSTIITADSDDLEEKTLNTILARLEDSLKAQLA